MTKWEYIGPFLEECEPHMWLRPETLGWDEYHTVRVGDTLEMFEFRQCVLCDSKQIREMPS